jgi:hypothetical protein
MSYARWGWKGSNVYVYVMSGGFECCDCAYVTSTDAILEHLKAHQARGDTVPTETFADLERDRAENERFFLTGKWPEGSR